MNIEKIKSSDLDELAYEKIKELILTGVLKPGDQIIQSQLAEVLGISRTPLRNALAQLEKEYLIVSENGRTYVRDFRPEELIIVFEIRAVLEGLVVKYFSKEPNINWLIEIEDKYRRAFESGDKTEYRKVDIEFHTGLAKMVDIPILKQIVNNFWILSVCLSKGLLREPHETINEHIAIIEALKRKEGEEARRLIVKHIEATIDKIKKREGNI